jgi:4-diphosphocytidyl-2-C-methyl-D-erythritol kinase
MRAAVTVRAPGKVNLHLAVGALDDAGYHEVRTVLQAVSVYDDLVATAPHTTGAVTLELTGEGADGLPTDRRNLAVRAAHLLAERAGVSEGVHLSISKHIPVAAGMAGGSADAAGALVACDAFWGTGLTRAELEVLAAELGSDVPFCVMGGTALGVGRGEQLTPVLSRGSYTWVFAVADGGLSTPAVYAELDRYREELPRPELLATSDLVAALRQGDVAAVGKALANDLQIPAYRLRPALRQVIAAGDALGVLGSLVSGSGPTCAFLCGDRDDALRVAEGLEKAGVCRGARVATGPVMGARVVEARD